MKNGVAVKLKILLARKRAILEGAKREYRSIKGGNLIIRHRKQWTVFCEEVHGKERGITTDKKRVYMLARKRYLKKEITYLQGICETLEKSIAIIEKKDENCSNVPAEVPESMYSAEELAWLKQGNRKNTIAPEALKYETVSGIKVRSKSERVIADKLTQYGLLFKYEAPIDLGIRSVYPDFAILRDDGQIVIWEHFGLMDKDDYAERTAQKIIMYQRYGYATHSNLICTWERDIETPQKIEHIIERFLL